MASKLKILSWNVNGLKAKLNDHRKAELLNIFDKYHIVLLQETHIGETDLEDITEKLQFKYNLEKLESSETPDDQKEEDDGEEKDEDDDDEEDGDEEEDDDEDGVEKENDDEEDGDEEEDNVVEENATMYYTYFSSNSKGVAIIINKKHRFVEYFSKGGDYAGVRVEIDEKKYTFVSVYWHSTKQLNNNNLTDKISTEGPDAIGTLVIGGDFNTTLNPELDANKRKKKHAKLRERLIEFMTTVNLLDVWREMHLRARRYTHSQIKNTKYTKSRLDYIFMSPNDLEYVTKCAISKKTAQSAEALRNADLHHLSDHYPVILILN